MGESDSFGSISDRLKRGIGDLAEGLGSRPLVGTALIRAFGLTKIPMLWFIRPSVVELNDERCVISIPLSRRTKNHLGCMYFAALAAGADLAAGLTAMRRIQQSDGRVDLIFKDFKVDFLKRVEAEAFFVCDQGQQATAAVEQALRTGERINIPMPVTVTVPSKLGAEPAARCMLTLSLKKKG